MLAKSALAVISKASALISKAPAVLSGEGAVTTEGGTSALKNLFDVGLDLTDFGFRCFDIIIAHPVLSIFVAGGVISLGVGIVSKFAGVSKSIS